MLLFVGMYHHLIRNEIFLVVVVGTSIQEMMSLPCQSCAATLFNCWPENCILHVCVCGLRLHPRLKAEFCKTGNRTKWPHDHTINRIRSQVKFSVHEPCWHNHLPYFRFTFHTVQSWLWHGVLSDGFLSTLYTCWTFFWCFHMYSVWSIWMNPGEFSPSSTGYNTSHTQVQTKITGLRASE